MRLLLVVGVLLALLSFAIGAIKPFLPASIQGVLSLPHEARVELLGLVAWIILIPLALLPMLFTLKRRFITSEQVLDKRLAQVRDNSASRDGIYRDFALYCPMNAWKLAVANLLEHSSIILMDLRGLTAERAGSLYELRLVIDRFPLGNVVMLANDEAEQRQLETRVRELLASAAADSPNRNVNDNELRIYQPGLYQPRDNRRLLAMLAAATARSGAGELSVKPGLLNAWQRFRAWFTRLGQAWRALTEHADMMVSRPPYSHAVIPVLMLLVATLFAYRVEPVVESWALFMNPRQLEVVTVVNPHQQDDATVLNPHQADAATDEARSPVALDKPVHPQQSVVEVVEVSKYYAYVGGWNGLSVRLDIYSEWAAQAMEYGQVEITRAEGDQQQSLKVVKVETPGIMSPDLLTTIQPVDRSLGISVGIDGTTRNFKSNEDGSVRVWLRLKPPKSINRVTLIEGSILLKLPDPALSTRVKLPDLPAAGSVRFTIPEMESLGEIKLTTIEGSDILSVEYTTAVENSEAIEKPDSTIIEFSTDVPVGIQIYS
jgi:hypothetical protein